MSDNTGQGMIRNYRILSVLGKGGMGAVYLCEDMNEPGSRWAVKELQPAPFMDTGEQEACRIMFYREAEFLEKLSHPSIPKFKEHFTEDGRSYLVMEYIQGRTLEDILKEEKPPISEPEAINLGLALCHVLNYLHSQKPPVLFRDLKPANIMITPEGRLMLVDFGIARCFVTEQRTDTFRMGTVGYASPEQYGGMGGTDARSDIYSLGALLHYLLTGRNPEESSPFSFPPVASLNRAVSPGFVNIVQGCLESEKSRRFASSEEIQIRLEALKSPRAVNLDLAVSQAKRALTRPLVPRQKSNSLRLAVLLFVFVILFFAWLIQGTHKNIGTTSTETIPQLPRAYDTPVNPRWGYHYMCFVRRGVFVSEVRASLDLKKELEKIPYPPYNNLFQVCDSKGTLYFFSLSRGVCRYRNRKLDVILPFPIGKGLLPIQAMTCDSRDRLWVLCPQGLGYYDGGDWTWLEVNEETSWMVSSLQKKKISPLFIALGYDLLDPPLSYYHSSDGDVCLFIGSTEISFMVDSRDRVWIWGGTVSHLNRANGLWMIDGERVKRLGFSDGLPSDAIYSVAEDKQGTIWVGGLSSGTNRSGLCRLREGVWESVDICSVIPDEPPIHVVRNIRPDPEDGVWVSTEQGLARYYKGELVNIPLPPNLCTRKRPNGSFDPPYMYNRFIQNFWVDPKRRVWVQSGIIDFMNTVEDSTVFLLDHEKWYYLRGTKSRYDKKKR